MTNRFVLDIIYNVVSYLLVNSVWTIKPFVHLRTQTISPLEYQGRYYHADPHWGDSRE